MFAGFSGLMRVSEFDDLNVNLLIENMCNTRVDQYILDDDLRAVDVDVIANDCDLYEFVVDGVSRKALVLRLT